jgi:hypothetical protein
LASAASAAASKSLLLAAHLALGDALQERDHLVFRQVAHEAVDRLAVDEAANTVGSDWMPSCLDRRMLVGIQFDQLDLALGGLDDLFEDRGELLAGAAPVGPEIDQHRLALRFLDHVLYERLGRGVLDQAVGGRGCCRSLLQHGVSCVLSLRPAVPSASAEFLMSATK